MSLYATRRTLYIQQLQGIAGTDVPRDLGCAWPKIFMEACRNFADKEGFEEMRVAQAASLYAYHYAGVRPDLVPDARERALQRIRTSMEMLYDANSLELGFIPDGRWFRWINPNIARQPHAISQATVRSSG